MGLNVFLDARNKRLAIVQIVEPDGKSRFGFCRNDVGRLVPDIQVRDLDIARLEPVRAFVEGDCFDLCQNSDKLRDRVVRKMRVSDMALRSGHRNPHIDGAAPTNLHHVAKPVDACWFTDKACIGNTAACMHMRD